MTSDEIQRARSAVDGLRESLRLVGGSAAARDDFRLRYQFEVGMKCLAELDAVLPRPRRLCDVVLTEMVALSDAPERGHHKLLHPRVYEKIMAMAKEEAGR